MSRKKHFKIDKAECQKEVQIKGLFRYNNRLWVIHFIDGSEKYRCSDYLTGMGIDSSDSWFFKKCKDLAKETIDRNKDFDYSKFKIINP